MLVARQTTVALFSCLILLSWFGHFTIFRTFFYKINKLQEYMSRLYRVHGKGSSIQLEPVPLGWKYLDPRFVFILDDGLKIYVWMGKKSKSTLRPKARLVVNSSPRYTFLPSKQKLTDVIYFFRLMAEKVNKEERKNMGEIFVFNEGQEVGNFWTILGASETGEGPSDPLEVGQK